MTDEQERIRLLRLRQAQQRALQAQQDQPGRVSGAMRPLALVNEGIARFGDGLAVLPNRAVNAGLGAMGSDYRLSEQPFADAFDAGGVARTPAEGMGESMLVGTGDAAGALIPGVGFLRLLSKAGGITGQVARAASSQYVAAPATAISAELAAGAVAPAAGELAVRATGREEARGLGAIGGGMGAGLAVGAVPNALAAGGNALMKTPLVGGAIRGVIQTAAPFTRTGGRMIAEDMVRSVTPDRFQAAENLAQENVGNLTPAQRTDDAGIMGIERARAAADPRARSALDEREAASRQALREEVLAPQQGRETADMKTFFSERLDHHRKAMDRYVEQAERRVTAALRQVTPDMPREEASRRAVDAINKAYDQAAAREAELWSRVPRDDMIGTSQARRALDEARKEATRVSEDAIPAKARIFLGDGPDALGENATMGELHRLYSEVRRAGREAMARPVPDEFTARQSGRIADAILADIEAAESTSKAARLLADARAYSREMNEAFGQGSVARLTARTRAGDDRIPPEVALRRTIGQGQEAGGVAVDDIRGAVGNQADAPMQDFLRDEFVGSVTGPDGAPNIRQIDSFARQNREALSRFGDGVGAEVQAVRQAAAQAARRSDRRDEVLAALRETTRGTVAGVVNAPKGREIAAGIFAADNPSAAARAIARAAQRDPTGDAYLGFKAGLVDEVIARSTAQGAISARKLDQTLRDPEMMRVLHAGLPAAELQRLRVVARQLSRLDKSAAAKAVDTENLPNQLISTFLQIQAAKVGRSMGTGTIQVPGMVVSRARQLLGHVATDRADAIIKAAMEDPQLLSDLLVGASASSARRLQAETRVANWAIGVLGTEIASEE